MIHQVNRVTRLCKLVNALPSNRKCGYSRGFGERLRNPFLDMPCLRPCLRRGLYIPDTDAYPAHFRGLGIRIEDSVCVQDDNPLVLTTEAVKEVRILFIRDQAITQSG